MDCVVGNVPVTAFDVDIPPEEIDKTSEGSYKRAAKSHVTFAS
jgi:hypothetical protein